MPFLNLKRLLPPRKMWKVFTNKLQIKLHKLNRSKAIKKSKFQSRKNSRRAKLGWPSLSIYRPKKFKPKPHTLTHFQKRTPDPVYVDQLFTVTEPVSRTEERLMKPENEIVMMSNHEKSNIAADDMWESSMVLNSPQTRGIDERAEEFIARFRAQMHRQELLARRL